jgi:hypothetical protein
MYIQPFQNIYYIIFIHYSAYSDDTIAHIQERTLRSLKFLKEAGKSKIKIKYYYKVSVQSNLALNPIKMNFFFNKGTDTLEMTRINNTDLNQRDMIPIQIINSSRVTAGVGNDNQPFESQEYMSSELGILSLNNPGCNINNSVIANKKELEHLQDVTSYKLTKKKIFEIVV